MQHWKARFYRTLGALAQSGGAMALVIASDEHSIAGVVVGGFLGLAGLLMWGKGAYERGLLDAEREEEATARSAARTEELVLDLQRQMAVLRAEHDVLLRAPWSSAIEAPRPLRSAESRRPDTPAGELRLPPGTTPLPPQ